MAQYVSIIIMEHAQQWPMAINSINNGLQWLAANGEIMYHSMSANVCNNIWQCIS